jgi:hypothetical protein
MAGHAIWWGKNQSGYTCDVDSAGRYSEEEADDILHMCGKGDVAIYPETYVLGMPSKRIIDAAYVRNRDIHATQAGNLINKQVTLRNPGGYDKYTGTVTGVLLVGDDWWANINWEIKVHPCTSPMQIEHLILKKENE